jgi:DNA-binding response OmpR family regulator
MDPKRKILVADPDKELVRSWQETLERQGYETLSAFEGIRVIEATHRKSPDLILMGLDLPVGSGERVLRWLKVDEKTRHIPVLILGGENGVELEATLRQRGAAAFFHRPYPDQGILIFIRQVLKN